MKRVLCALFLIICAAICYGKIYKYVDKFGVVHLTNQIPDEPVYEEVRLKRDLYIIKDSWAIKNKATEYLKKLLKEIEKRKAQQLEQEKEVKKKKIVKTKVKYIPAQGVGSNQDDTIKVTVQKISEGHKFYTDKLQSFTCTVKNLSSNKIYFDPKKTKIYIENEMGVIHYLKDPKLSLKEGAPFAEKLPYNQSILPKKSGEFLLVFSPVEKPTYITIDSFMGVKNGKVRIKIIHRKVEVVDELATELAKKALLEKEKKEETTQQEPQDMEEDILLKDEEVVSSPSEEQGEKEKEKKDTTYPYLGLKVKQVDEDLAEQLELVEVKGLYVIDVPIDSAAFVGGVRKGDVILQIDGRDVNTIDDLHAAIDKKYPGDRIFIQVNRENIIRSFSVVKKK